MTFVEHEQKTSRSSFVWWFECSVSRSPTRSSPPQEFLLLFFLCVTLNIFVFQSIRYVTLNERFPLRPYCSESRVILTRDNHYWFSHFPRLHFSFSDFRLKNAFGQLSKSVRSFERNIPLWCKSCYKTRARKKKNERRNNRHHSSVTQRDSYLLQFWFV